MPESTTGWFRILFSSCWGPVSQPRALFQQPRAKSFVHSSIYGSTSFSTTKTRPPPKHKNILKSISPKNHHPRLVGRIGGIRITGLHLGWSHHWYPRTAGGPRFSQGPWKTTRLCTENSISKYFGWGGFLEDSLPTFLETTSFGGSENLMVGDYTLFLEFWRTFPFVRCQWRQFYRFAFEGWRKRQWFCLAVRNGNLIRSRKPYCFDLGWA